ncbi:MAG: hypothetical protein JWN98_180 [Abditibacteriota bacterium]|nr:hypothetical protein [Abditibacteriota bacterium]
MSTLTKDTLLQNPDVKQMIAERAYFISEASGFAAGRDFDFWLQAENEMLSYLAQSPVTSASTGAGEAAPKKATRKAAAPKVAKMAAAPRKRTVKKAAE